MFVFNQMWVMEAAVACGTGVLDSTRLVIVLDVFEGPQTSWCTTTLTDSTQQQRMTQNGHNHFCNKSENFWMARQQRERGRGALFVGQCCPALLEQCQSTGESNRGLISHRMHCQSCRGLCSKWELVHYGAAARYFTTDLDVGEDK